jgi:hypothetical protein
MLADQLSGVVITVQYLSASAATRVKVFEFCDIIGVAGDDEIRFQAVARSHDGERGTATRNQREGSN